MPKIKNTFLKSRMNKDTEARILPQGEYRDAQNASVSASEDASVGSLENIRGNKLLTNFGLKGIKKGKKGEKGGEGKKRRNGVIK